MRALYWLMLAIPLAVGCGGDDGEDKPACGEGAHLADGECVADEEADTDTDTDTDTPVDADGDGTIESEDCDDSDPESTTIATDADCDGILTEEDCDDADAESTTIATDADCDGVLTADDCDDTDVVIPTSDRDCDGTFTAEDCDDDDPESTVLAIDADCDGTETYLDCDDTDPESTTIATDVDCDAVLTADDCDDTDATMPAEDSDCDGTLTAYDCDDDDPDSTTLATDGDCDGIPTSEDCDDTDPLIPAEEALWTGSDRDCDGSINNISAESYDASLSGDEDDFLSFDNAISVTDLTGDGIPDVLVGSAFLGGDFDDDGYWDFRGGVHLLDGADHATWDGAAESFADASILGAYPMNYLSTMSATQGDINGDGEPDLVVGGTDAAREYSGYADTALGIFLSAGTLSGTYMIDEADITFIYSQSNYGAVRVHSDLDLDGDGLNEVVFGDYISGYYNPSGVWYNYGATPCYFGACGSAVYVFKGASLESGASYDLIDDADVVMSEEISYDYFGQTLGGGDLDGDGADELIVAAPGRDTEEYGVGCISILRGGDPLVSGEMVTDMDDIDFYLEWGNTSICAETEDTRLGWNASPQVADFNGDGELDLAIGGHGSNRVFVFFSIGDSLGGAYEAESDADVVIVSVTGPSGFGYALASGDMNGDGIADLAIGAPDVQDPVLAAFEYHSIMGTEAVTNGKVYLYDGTSLSGVLTETDADGTITSESADMFGITLVAQDMNGDGKSDLWVGAPQFDGDRGRATLYLMPESL
jgi:hypothetical protein